VRARATRARDWRARMRDARELHDATCSMA
jgi:hypothetical protein